MHVEEKTGMIDKIGEEPSFSPLAPGQPRQRRAIREVRNTTRFFMFFDVFLVWISGAIASGLTFTFSPITRSASTLASFFKEFAGFLLVFSVLTVLFANLRGLYAFAWRSRIRRLMKLEAESVASAAIVTGSSMYLRDIGAVPGKAVFLSLFLSWISLVAWRKFIESQPISGLTERRNVLIAGCGRNARLLRAHLEQNPELGYVVKGFLDRRREPRAPKGVQDEAGEGLLGDVQNLPAIVRAHFIDEIFISVPSDRALVQDVAQHAFAAGLSVRVVPDMCDGLAVNRPVEYIGSFPTLALHTRPTATLSLLFKRLLDVIVSNIALIALLPLFALIAVIVKLDSKGGAFYKSVRVGKKGKTFNCYKFRTMVANADALKESLSHLNERRGILFKIAADPRMTRVGRVLRKFSLDELPQLWNVWKGDMSLVGPRPCVPGEYKQYSLEHLRRLDVAPGITGLWQVEARQNPSFESYISLDKNYVDRWSLWLDCRILLKTMGVVLAGTGR